MKMRKDTVINDVQTLVISKDIYKTEEEFWESVAEMLKILTKNYYECKFYYEDCDNYVIEFAHERHEYGGSSCVWISAEEHDAILDMRMGAENSEKEEKKVEVE